MTDQVFDLYDREKLLLAEGQQILDSEDPLLIQQFATRLFDRFGKLVRENEDLTRHSDRQEQRLVKLNRNLKLQTQEVEQQRQSFEALSIQLSKYLPPQIHQAMFAGKYDTNVATTRKKLTVFFSDIQNFTQTTDALQPEELTEYLNEYFSEMTQIALFHGATIDKYIGDAVMLFFGDPDSKGVREDARACVKMALEMQEQMKALQHRWRARGFANPFVIRIGINTGYCNVGNFGSDQRLSYTIIGGEVNIAQRLESASDAGGILISQETYLQVEDLVEVQERQAVNLKGIDRNIRTYAIKGYLADSHRKVKVSHPAGIHVDVQLSTLTHEQREEISEQLITLARQIKP